MKTIFAMLALLLSLPLIAEEKDPLRFFPHAVGNRWEYGSQSAAMVIPYVIESDSVDGEGNVFFFLGDRNYKVQKDGKVYTKASFYDDTVYGLEYDFAAPVGTIWRRYNKSHYSGKVTKSYKTILFGKFLDAVDIRVTSLTDEDDSTMALAGSVLTFVEGIGLVSDRDIEANIYHLYLKGAIIDGDTIGTITSVENGVPSQACLYPNPAAEYIMVSIEPSSHGKLRIAFSDYLGRESFVLYDGEPPSEGKLLLDLRAIPSGCYLCRISAGSRTTAHPVTIVR